MPKNVRWRLNDGKTFARKYFVIWGMRTKGIITCSMKQSCTINKKSSKEENLLGDLHNNQKCIQGRQLLGSLCFLCPLVVANLRPACSSTNFHGIFLLKDLSMKLFITFSNASENVANPFFCPIANWCEKIFDLFFWVRLYYVWR